jgi:hypothetical protein
MEEMVVFLHRYSMATYFLKDFLQPDSENVEEMVVFLQRYADISNWSPTSSRISSIPTGRRWMRWSSSYTGMQTISKCTNLFNDFFHPGRGKVEEMVVFLHRYSMQIFQTGHLLPQGLPPS